ncbi:MAG: N-acetylglutaminylglutamine amidotransferase, partial [Bdellovibrionales bacterium]|nr:N-acetylglutaminylglutamine amidotransferase [Bdellovibrionales bacterium]
MCGICGEIRFDSEQPNLAALDRMNLSMQNRGPDSSGVFSQGHVAFGHRRLKIIDLTENAQQPMVDSALGLTLVYNGAIYNYEDLRSRLESYGYRFFSSGDTEVILKAYHYWGKEFVNHLHGMFAFAIFERDSGDVILGRDRLGIKPLYLARTAGALKFASTLPALISGGGINTEINPVGLHHYMTFHSVVPAPHTILKGVTKLPPATILKIKSDGTQEQTVYWGLPFESSVEDLSRSFAEWQELVIEALRASVRRRLVADVPVGVLLSGGLDSSLVVGLLAENGQKGLSTFSIGFDSIGEEMGDEFKYSDLIAQTFQTQHYKIKIGENRIKDSLHSCVAEMSEPMVSHDNIGFYLLAQEVSKHLKVVQSGQGADEIFAGYHWYPPLLNSDNPVEDYSKVFFDLRHDEYQRFVSRRFVQQNYSQAFLEDHFFQPGASLGINKALRLDTQVMLTEDPVKRVDNMTMAWGLEARVPFLDHELVELAARIPPEFKIKSSGKYVLKEAARRVIPNE